MPRSEVFLRAIDALQHGRSVDLIGDQGNGKTHLLGRIKQHFLALGWTAIEVSGFESLRQTSLAALSVAGLLDDVDVRRPQLTSAHNAVNDLVVSGRTIIIIDDVDYLDNLSRGVLEAITVKSGVPMLSARRPLRVRGSAPESSAGSRATYSLEVSAMGYRELETSLAAALNVKLEPVAMSRVFAKSGGNVGLAVAIVDAAVREGNLRARDGMLRADGSLWTPSLRTITERMLQPLDATDLFALKTLAILGPIDFDTVANVVSDALVLSLEARGYVTVVQAAARRVVVIRPPLIVEHFLHESTTSQRSSILANIDDAFSSMQPTLPDSAADRRDPAVNIRLIHQASRLRTLNAREAWRAEPSFETAISLLQALEADAFHGIDETDALLAAVQKLDGTPRQHAEWSVVYASHVAHDKNRTGDALEILRVAAIEFPSESAVLRAHALVLEMTVGQCPAVDPLADISIEELSGSARMRVLATRAQWLLIRGRVPEAEEVLLQCRGIDEASTHMEWVSIYCQIAQGNLELAARHAEERFAQAEADFDGPRIRIYAFLVAFTALMARRLEDAEQSTAIASALGLPPGEAPQSYIGLTVLSAYFAIKRGQRSVVNEYLMGLDASALPDGPLPGLQRAHIYSRLALLDGRAQDSGQISADAADQLWGRGARLAAAYQYIDGIISHPTPAAWEHAEPRLRLIEAEGVRQLAEFARVLSMRDAKLLLEHVRQLQVTGRREAVYLARRAISALEEYGNSDEHVLKQLRKAIQEAGVSHLSAAYVELSPREREVAALVATGSSNPMIAEALVLSIRTVESHINKVMKKLGASRREDIRDHLLVGRPVV